MRDELPKNWATAPLDSLCQKFRGVSYGRDDASAVPQKDLVPILRANNLQNDRLVFDDLVWVSADHVNNQQKLRTGDIVIAMSSGSKSVVGKTAQVMEDWQGSFGAFCGVLRPWPELNSRYVGLFLRTRKYRNTISELAAGSNINNLKNEHLAAIEVPVAPLAEQRRIVAKLEKLLGQVDACQQRLEKMPKLLKRFRQSILAAACSGRLTADWREENEIEVEDGVSEEVPDSFPSLPETWRWQLLESVCEKIVDCPHSTPKWAESGRLCVRTTNFKPGFLDLSVVRYVSDATFNERIERLLPKPGDILYSREGGILGIACMIPPKVELCLGQRMMLFRTKSDFSSAFLMHWLNSRVILGRVQELTGGSASPHLNVRDIKSFPTPVAPLAEQREIVRRVASLFALAHQLEQRLAQARKQVDKLTPSLLARAFAGKLVPQNPADEPADQLLERIRKQPDKSKHL